MNNLQEFIAMYRGLELSTFNEWTYYQGAVYVCARVRAFLYSWTCCWMRDWIICTLGI